MEVHARRCVTQRGFGFGFGRARVVAGFRRVRAAGRLPRVRVVAGATALALLLVRLPLRAAETSERPLAVVDLHVDLAYQHVFRALPFETGSRQYVAAELERAGVVGVVLPLFIPDNVAPGGPRLADLERSFRSVFGALSRTAPFALPGLAHSAGGIRTWLAFEGAAPLAADPRSLRGWVERGVRSIGLVHTRHNALASSSGDPAPSSEGLTAAGRALVREAHALGVPIDVSHASERALSDVLALASEAQMPVIATHSNAYALAAHPRNLRDDQLRAIAASGGVVGVNFHSTFLVPTGRARLADVVKHIRHLVRVMGSDHVAIGSDFEGGIRPPSELASARAFPSLARELQRSGLSREVTAQIFSENALRVLSHARAARPVPGRAASGER